MKAAQKKTSKEVIEIINIVPLPGKGIQGKTTATPQLIYNGGPLLSSVEICPIFWGDAWNQPAQKLVSQYLFTFFQTVVASPFLDQLSEYSVPSFPIKHGSVTPIIQIPHKFTLPLVRDATIQTMIKKQIAGGILPPVNANKLYFVYLPPGISVQQGTGISCEVFCGYHDAIGTNIFYAVVPYADCKSCLNGLTLNDALTSISSHELAEAITDPLPGKGWYDNNFGEVGDICVAKTAKLPNTKYIIQLEWSNKQNACII